MMTMRFVPILTAVAIVSGASAAAGQDAGYGAKVGVNLATIGYDPEQTGDFGMRLGLVAGGFASLPLGGRLALQPEVLFSQKGESVEGGGVKGKTTLNYLEVPVLLTYSLSGDGSRGFFIFGGSSMAFKLSAESSATFGDQDIDIDLDEEIENLDFGVVAGAGKAFGRLTIDGRYTHGLTNLSIDDSDGIKARNRTISVQAGVRF
jgi:Outer membrane protein beta-barrel domain